MGSSAENRPVKAARLWLGRGGAFVLSMSCASAWAACAPDRIELRGTEGQAAFSVEIADDPAERALGLMYRESLASGAGMLFLYSEPRALSFWMKNTRIPLDIMFINEQGIVQKIENQARPFDETPMPGGDAIQYVLEVNGGRAKALGIEPGWQVRNPLLDQSKADWRCQTP